MQVCKYQQPDPRIRRKLEVRDRRGIEQKDTYTIEPETHPHDRKKLEVRDHRKIKKKEQRPTILYTKKKKRDLRPQRYTKK